MCPSTSKPPGSNLGPESPTVSCPSRAWPWERPQLILTASAPREARLPPPPQHPQPRPHTGSGQSVPYNTAGKAGPAAPSPAQKRVTGGAGPDSQACQSGPKATVRERAQGGMASGSGRETLPGTPAVQLHPKLQLPKSPSLSPGAEHSARKETRALQVRRQLLQSLGGRPLGALASALLAPPLLKGPTQAQIPAGPSRAVTVLGRPLLVPLGNSQ